MIVDLTPETGSQNIFETVAEELVAGPAAAAPAAGPPADDADDTEPDTVPDTYADTEVDSSSSQAPEEEEVHAPACSHIACYPIPTGSCMLAPIPEDEELQDQGCLNGSRSASSSQQPATSDQRPATCMFAPIPENEELQDQGHTNGSCMPIRDRSRSPQRRVAHSWVWMPASEQKEHAERREVRRSAAQLNYVPPYAEHALRNLPPYIKKSLPSFRPEDMTFSELFAHCLQKIAVIKGNFPRRWYIGICHCPLFRWILGHDCDYDCLHLLVAASSSRVTRPLEQALIIHFQEHRDLLLQNVTPEAVGSTWGSPHFLYIGMTACDASNALIRRRRG